MKNIFLTGKRRVGKTTIIKQIILQLKLSPGGFMVIRDGSQGNWTAFYLQCAEDAIYGEERPSLLRPFARRDSDEDWKIDPMVFNQEGVYLLENEPWKRDIIIMDELGRFEREAIPFQKRVEEILSSNVPVLGVLKDESHSFLNQIRERRDVELVYVEEMNREEVFCTICGRIQKILQDR